MICRFSVIRITHHPNARTTPSPDQNRPKMIVSTKIMIRIAACDLINL